MSFLEEPVKDLLGISYMKEGCVGEKQGTDRLGSKDLIGNMGMIFIVGVALIVLLLLLGLCLLFARKSTCVKKVAKFIKKKLLYNSILRFMLQSTLKNQVSAGVIIQAYMIKREKEAELLQSSFYVSLVIVFVFSCCPFLFYKIVSNNVANLDKQEIKDKIGTLYNGLNAKRPSVMTYSPMFLIRRSMFIAIMFVCFEQPAIQVQLMIYMTILYLIYVGHQDFYETRHSKSLEILNESLFVVLMYNMVLLNSLLNDQRIIDYCGQAIVGLAGLLLGINLTVIIVVSIKYGIR